MQLKQGGSAGMYEKPKSFVKSGNTRFKVTSAVPLGFALISRRGGKRSP